MGNIKDEDKVNNEPIIMICKDKEKDLISIDINGKTFILSCTKARNLAFKIIKVVDNG